MSNSIADKLKSEAFILAAIPVLGSLSAFAFESGYLIFYDVPLELIEVGLNRILWSAFCLSFLLALLWLIGSRIYTGLTSKSKRIRYFWNFIITATFVGLVAWSIYEMPILAASLIWPVLLLLVRTIDKLFGPSGKFSQRAPEISRAVIEAQEHAERTERHELVLTGPFSVILIALAITGTVGYNVANFEKTAWVLTDQQNFLLVRKYGDRYIFKEFDIKNHQLKKRVLIRGADDEKGIELEKIRTNGLAGTFTRFPK